MHRFCPVLFSLLACTAVAGTPQYARVFVVDVSGSMSSRMEAVRAELKAQLAAQPATASCPISIITFSVRASTPMRFADNAAAVRYIETLRYTEGGTSIASGLLAAVDELKYYQEVPTSVLGLITDDEDSAPDATKSAERELAKLFGHRQDRGLAQAVLLRRWSLGGGVGQLFANLEKQSGVAVVDSVSAALNAIPIRCDAEIDVASSRLQHGSQLEVNLLARFSVTDLPSGFAVPVMRLECSNPLINGTLEGEIKANEAGSFSAIVSLSPEQMAQGQCDLQLTLVPAQANGKKLLPVLRSSRFTKTVKFDSRTRFDLRTAIDPSVDLKWDTAKPSRAIFGCRLTLEPTQTSGVVSIPKTMVSLKGFGGYQIVSPNRTAEITAGVATHLDIMLAKDLTPQELSKGEPASPPSVSVSIDASPKNVTFVANPVIARAKDLPLLPPSITKVDVRAKSVSKAVWHALPNVAWCRIDLDINVDGKLLDSEFRIIGSSQIRDIKLTPSKLRTGKQSVRMDVAVLIAPEPATERLGFTIIPPADSSQLSINCTESLEVDVEGPPKARLVLTQACDLVRVAPWRFQAESEHTISIEGRLTDAFQSSLRIEGVHPTKAIDSDLRLDEAIRVTSELPSAANDSYFFGWQDNYEMEFRPAVSTAAVSPVTVSIPIKRFGRFGLHLALLAVCVIAIVLVIFFLKTLVWV
ncbi:MAG: vWA domain-containing protein [Planctomycetota bacterium]